MSREDAAELESLRTFTRELTAEADLHTKLDWVAANHWNTDHPHVRIVIRVRADGGKDLVISRAYISQGFHERAAERATLELGPRTERDIRSSLEREVDAGRWTNLDRALRDNGDAGAGIVDLRPGAAGEDPEPRRQMIRPAAKLERLGLAEQVAPVPTVNPKQLSIACESVNNHGDGRSPRVDLVRRCPAARSLANRSSRLSASAQCVEA